MKHLMILLVGVCLLLASVPAMADQAEDEAAIRKMQQQIMAAHAKQDAKAIAALMDEDFQNWDGTVKGRAAEEKQRRENFERQKVQAKILDEIGIVFVTPEVAIYKFRVEITGSLDADGKPLPPLKMLYASVCVKKNDKWLRAAVFNRPVEE